MKKILAIILVVLMTFSMAACGSTNDPQNQGGDNGNSQQGGQQNDPNGQQNDPNGQQGNTGTDIPTDKTFEVIFTDGENSKSVEFTRLPKTEADLDNLDFSNEYEVAAAIVAVLDYYGEDADACFAMLNCLKGPEDISAYDKDFIKNQYDQYPYVARSYREGATPENNYTAEAIKYIITENPYSRDEEGYVKLYFKSGGADSERGVTLRYKPSTSQWFLFSDSYKGLMAGIRIPAEDDKWN